LPFSSSIREEGATQLNFIMCPVVGCGAPIESETGQNIAKCGHDVSSQDREKIHQELKLAAQFFGRGRNMLAGQQGRETEAVKCFEHSLQLWRARLGPHPKQIGENEDAIAEAHSLLGDYAEAAKHCATSIDILVHTFGEASMVSVHGT
jgi:hypothetical protein